MLKSTRRSVSRTIALFVVAALGAAGCAGGDDDASTVTDPPVADTGPDTALPADPPATDSPATDLPTTDPVVTEPAGPADDGVLEVPGEFATIQEAVDAAAEGDLVLISEGTYVEAVDVTTHNLTIRGLDRDRVVLDGELELDSGIRVLGANGVAVENLTVMNYTNNGLLWVASQGYRASYITTYRTGDYGIYAFDSVGGQIEFSHTVGSRGAGVYVGQCYPCDAVVNQVVSSHNGVGYSGTNAGGNLLIINSTWHDNRVGLAPNSGSYELCYPQRETTIVGNLVYDNNNQRNAAWGDSRVIQLNGIVIAGGLRNIVERNRVDNHARAGIAIVPYTEYAPNDNVSPEDEWDLPCSESRLLPLEIPEGAVIWQPYDNVVRDNVVSNSGDGDIGLYSSSADVSTLRNCFGGNTVERFAPVLLEQLAPCDGEGIDGDWTDGDLNATKWLTEFDTLAPDVPWQDMLLPPLDPHDNMPDAATAPARPAIDVPFAVDLDAITVPDLPAN